MRKDRRIIAVDQLRRQKVRFTARAGVRGAPWRSGAAAARPCGDLRDHALQVEQVARTSSRERSAMRPHRRL